MKVLILNLIFVSTVWSAVLLEKGSYLNDHSLSEVSVRRLKELYKNVEANKIMIEGRITNGLEAELHQFPFQVAMFLQNARGDKIFCGASIISSFWVITAAHCLYRIVEAEVYFGVHDIRNGPALWGVLVKSVDMIIHENYSDETLFNDIGLLRMPFGIPLDGYIKAIQLPTRAMASSLTVGSLGTTSGWGLTGDKTNSISSMLRYVDLLVVPNSDCARTFGSYNILASHLCVSGKGGKSTCSGDSGGPLTLSFNSTKYLFGITSFGALDGCMLEYEPVFTRVTSFLNWIENNTNVTIV